MTINPSAFFPFLILIVSQLLGQWVEVSCGLPLPGAVIGAAILFVALCLIPGLHARISPFAHTLLRNMLLFYVPASVGIMAVVDQIADRGPMLLAIIFLGTWATALTSAIVFDLCRRRLQEPTP